MREIVENFIASFAPDFDLERINEIISQFESNLVHLRKIFIYFDRSLVFANRIDGFSSLSDIIHDLIRK